MGRRWAGWTSMTYPRSNFPKAWRCARSPKTTCGRYGRPTRKRFGITGATRRQPRTAGRSFSTFPTPTPPCGRWLGPTGGGGARRLAAMLVDRHDPRIVLLAGEILFVPAALAATQATDMGSLTWAVAAMALFSTPVFTAIASFAPYLTDQPERLGL